MKINRVSDSNNSETDVIRVRLIIVFNKSIQLYRFNTRDSIVSIMI